VEADDILFGLNAQQFILQHQSAPNGHHEGDKEVMFMRARTGRVWK
jgi:hypothetical protein